MSSEMKRLSLFRMEKERDFMREKCKKKEGQRHALPPQIFNGEEYRGVRAVHDTMFIER